MKEIEVGDIVTVKGKVISFGVAGSLQVSFIGGGLSDQPARPLNRARVVDVESPPPEPPKPGEIWVPTLANTSTTDYRVISCEEGWVFFMFRTKLMDWYPAMPCSVQDWMLYKKRA